jgi:hypothetical protein
MHERAVFIHSYLSDTDKGGKSIPDRPTRACILAAAELKRRNKVDAIALSVIPELSEPITKRLKTLLPKSLDESDIISTENTVTTKGEVREIKRLSEEKVLDEAVSIVISPHKKRVEENVRRLFGKNQATVAVKTFDEVLTSERQDGLYDGIINESESWSLFKQFEKQEVFAQRLSKIPFIGEFLVRDAPDLLPGKLKIWLQKRLLKHL